MTKITNTKSQAPKNQDETISKTAEKPNTITSVQTKSKPTDNPQEPKKTKTGKKPPKPYNRKYDRKNVIALKQQGLSMTDIAKIEGTSITTISNYLDSIDPQLKQIQRYNNSKANALSLSQLKLQTVSNILVDKWIEQPEILQSLDMRLQKELLVACQGAKTYEHTAERLERGQTTQNIGQLIAHIEGLQAVDNSQVINVDN
ncbi:MAG: hypothetical protein WC332_00290 [Clostridia bacterium]